MLCHFLFSPQVKRSTIITNKHGIYNFSHELPNDLRLSISANQQSLKTSWNNSQGLSVTVKIKLLLILAKSIEKEKVNISRSIFLMKTRVSLKYYVSTCLFEKYFCCSFAPNLFKLNFFDDLSSKSEHLSSKTILTFALLGNFQYLFTEVEIWY